MILEKVIAIVKHADYLTHMTPMERRWLVSIVKTLIAFQHAERGMSELERKRLDAGIRRLMLALGTEKQ